MALQNSQLSRLLVRVKSSFVGFGKTLKSQNPIISRKDYAKDRREKPLRELGFGSGSSRLSEMSTSSQKPQDLLVFIIRRDSECGECGKELWHGSFITLEREKGALCLSCADLDHLVYLPAGDAALTRRAAKHSRLHAKVLQWSRTRKRYERQGILVESEALDKAEEECLADEEARRRRRERAAMRRAELDAEYVQAFGEHILRVFPKCPPETAAKIAEHACRKYSGRVGRSAAAKAFDDHAIELAVQAHVRHVFTDYDELLSRGVDRYEARDRVRGEVLKKLETWR